MSNQKIYVLGNDDVVIMFGLIGIEGVIIEKQEDFFPIFENLISDPSIGMIIINLALTEDQITYLLNFKLNSKHPFIYLLPNIFDEEAESEIFLKKFEDILKPLTKI